MLQMSPILLSFHFLDSIPWSTKVLHFDEIHFTHFSFRGLYFWHCLKKLLNNPRSQRFMPLFSFRLLINLSWFWKWCEVGNPPSFFYIGLSNFSHTVCWKDCTVHCRVLASLLKISWPQMYGFISWPSILFLDLYVYLYASTILGCLFGEWLKEDFNTVSRRSQISDLKSQIKESRYGKNWTRRGVAEQAPFEVIKLNLMFSQQL